MAVLTTEECRKIISSYINDNSDEYILSGVDFASAIIPKESKSLFGKSKIEYSDRLSKVWFGNPSEGDLKKVTEDIISNANKIHCVIDDHLIFFENKFILISTLGSRDNFPYSGDDNLHDIVDLELIEIDNEYTEGLDGVMTIQDCEGTGYCADMVRVRNHIDAIKKSLIHLLETKNQQELDGKRSEILHSLPLDSSGNLILIDCSDFDKLVKENQQQIIAIDRVYVHNFVKISSYLKQKNSNIRRVYEYVLKANLLDELDWLQDLIAEEIYRYNLILLQSLSMVVSLLDDDMMSFYEVYEICDQHKIFDSRWERDTAEKLDGITSGIANVCDILGDILRQSQRMEANLLSALGKVASITQSSLGAIQGKLDKMHSTLKVNTLLTGIQTYETYKIRRLN